MNRQQKVQWLTANCACWKGKAQVLSNTEAFSDEDINGLVKNAQQMVTNARVARLAPMMAHARRLVKSPHLILNAGEGDSGTPGEVAGINIGELAKFFGVEADPAQDPAGFIKELRGKLEEVDRQLGGTEPDEDDVATDSTGAAGDAGGDGDMNSPTTMSRGDIARLVNTAVRNALAESGLGEHAANLKAQYVNALLAHVRDPRQRAVKANALGKKSLAELKELVSYLPVGDVLANDHGHGGSINLGGPGGGASFGAHAPVLDPVGQPLYFGAAGTDGGQTANAEGGDYGEDYDPPVINYRQEVETRRGGGHRRPRTQS